MAVRSGRSASVKASTGVADALRTEVRGLPDDRDARDFASRVRARGAGTAGRRDRDDNADAGAEDDADLGARLEDTEGVRDAHGAHGPIADGLDVDGLDVDGDRDEAGGREERMTRGRGGLAAGRAVVRAEERAEERRDGGGEGWGADGARWVRAWERDDGVGLAGRDDADCGRAVVGDGMVGWGGGGVDVRTDGWMDGGVGERMSDGGKVGGMVCERMRVGGEGGAGGSLYILVN